METKFTIIIPIVALTILVVGMVIIPSASDSLAIRRAASDGGGGFGGGDTGTGTGTPPPRPGPQPVPRPIGGGGGISVDAGDAHALAFPGHGALAVAKGTHAIAPFGNFGQPMPKLAAR